jgi:O-antigen/teichoic acid export membrane protein
MRAYCHKKYEECMFKPKTYYDKALMKEMTGFAGWNFLTSSSSMVGQYGLGIVLNHFFGTILNAAQGVANQFCGQLQVFSNTMLKALNPVIVKSAGAGNNTQMLNISMTGCKFSFFLLAFFAIPFLIDAEFVMRLWLKKVPEWGVMFFRFQIIRVLIEQLTFSLGISIYAQGDINSISKIRSIMFILPILLATLFFYWGYPPYSMYIGWIVCWSIIGGGITLYYAVIKCNLTIKDYIRKVLKPCLILFCIVFLLTIIPYMLIPVGLIRFVSICLLSMIAFILMLWNCSLTNMEKQTLQKIIRLKSLKPNRL